MFLISFSNKTQAFHAEHVCMAGDTIMSAEAWAMVKSGFQGIPVDGDPTLMRVTRLRTRLPDVPVHIMRHRAMYGADFATKNTPRCFFFTSFCLLVCLFVCLLACLFVCLFVQVYCGSRRCRTNAPLHTQRGVTLD
jgi:hypothetical protein